MIDLKDLHKRLVPLKGKNDVVKINDRFFPAVKLKRTLRSLTRKDVTIESVEFLPVLGFQILYSTSQGTVGAVELHGSGGGHPDKEIVL